MGLQSSGRDREIGNELLEDSTVSLQQTIDEAWQERNEINPEHASELRAAVKSVLGDLDAGRLRVAEKKNGSWVVNQWAKKAVLLSFVLNQFRRMSGAPDGTSWWDKIPPKGEGWNDEHYGAAGFRSVPMSYVRHSAFIASSVVLMPCFVNVGAYVDSGTMVDTWATIGSCAQIGKNCHVSGGAGIGGVLEPLQATPVVVEDNCFIGARSEVVEGVIVEQGSVISMGVYLGSSTKIVDRSTGAIHYGKVPAYSVVVPGSLPQKPFEDGSHRPSLYCAVIVKTVDERTRAKTSITELLRD